MDRFDEALDTDWPPWGDDPVLPFFGSIARPCGISEQLLSPEMLPDYRYGGPFQSLANIVNNLGSDENQLGWIPGGVLYLRASRGAPALGNWDILRALLDDPVQTGTIHGVILDLRVGGTLLPDGYALAQYEAAASYLDFFVQSPLEWGTVTGYEGTKTLKMLPTDHPWPDLSVVALVDPYTPGALAMALQAIPCITTVGQASGPVVVTTRPFQMESGNWGYFPNGTIRDYRGRNVSLCRIEPDVEIPLKATFDAAVIEAMEILGLEQDPRGNFCPRE